jgi:2-amino-4-hydroxy-6-hydroxymethyldihydropteridine diphosphokinase
MKVHQAVVALGGNIGDREATLDSAIAELASLGDVVSTSSFYETVYEGNQGPQAAYLNAAVRLETDLTVGQLFAALGAIEKRFGRLCKGDSSPRSIDLDLIFFDRMMADFGDLILPHPRMHLRRFVLDPVFDIAPDWEHPVLKQSIRSLAQR